MGFLVAAPYQHFLKLGNICNYFLSILGHAYLILRGEGLLIVVITNLPPLQMVPYHFSVV